MEKIKINTKNNVHTYTHTHKKVNSLKIILKRRLESWNSKIIG